MINKKIQWLVITDLDGTLLNHHTYAWDEALAAIQLLQKKPIPIIFNTSKTYSETLSIRHSLGIHDPFIVENGSCIYLPKQSFARPSAEAAERDAYWAIQTGKQVSDISNILHRIDIDETNYTRLSQCSIDQAVTLTGLNQEQAKQAIAREFSEPLIWHGDDETLFDFQQQLLSNELSTVQGGRFIHVLGKCDKGHSTKLVSGYYGNNTSTIVLGDSANDLAMLSVADISIIVNSPSNHQLSQLFQPTIQTVAPAPAGWSEAINKALQLNHQT